MDNKHKLGFNLLSILVMLILVSIFIILGLTLWNKTQVQHTSSNSEETPVQSKQVLKIPELDIGFEIKDGITPLYAITEQNWEGVSYQLVRFSTQQMVNKSIETSSDKSPCNFVQGVWSDDHFSLFTVGVYRLKSDLLAIEREGRSDLQESDINPSNGYITIGNNLFSIPKTIQSGSGICLEGDTDFESDQRVKLRDSLLTIRSL